MAISAKSRSISPIAMNTGGQATRYHYRKPSFSIARDPGHQELHAFASISDSANTIAPQVEFQFPNSSPIRRSAINWAYDLKVKESD